MSQRLFWVLCSGLSMLGSAATCATPWIPTDPTQIIERLPAGMPQPMARTSTPKTALSLEQAAPQIEQRLEQAYLQGDPRALGQAEALLAPFAANTSPQARLLRAAAAQADHRFAQAKIELTALLNEIPNQADAVLMLSSIELVQGNFAAAKQHCQGLRDLSVLTLRLACIAQVEAMTGQINKAKQQLATLANMTNGMTDSQARWIYLMQADIAQRSNDAALALDVFSKLDRQSMPALMARADWLLAHRQWQKTRDLLINHLDNDSLLLRLVISEINLGHPDAAKHQQLLGERVAIWQQRGETAHQREQAAYQQLIGPPAKALQIARENWQKQRETADVVVYATAALAAHSAADLSILQDWISSTGFEYPALISHLKRGHLPTVAMPAGVTP